MKAKNKIKNILACFAVLIALVCSCGAQTIMVAKDYASTAFAKVYASENKTDPYEFDSAGKWSRSTNYSSVTIDGNTVNAFDKTTVSQNLATLEKEGKPSELWNGDSTTVEGDDKNLDKFKVMMIDAKQANVKQEKEVKDDDGNYVYETDTEGNFIYETNDKGETVYYEASKINTSDKKYVPVEETDTENAGKYKAKVIKKEPTDIYYYYKSNSISLSKQSYYVISFWVYTVGDAYASLRVANSTETFDAKVENIKSENEWKKVYLFLETRADGSANTVYISLYFGNTETILGANEVDTANENDQKITGSVYFDTLEFKTINYTDFANKTIDGKSPEETNKQIADNYSNRFYYDLIANPDFDGEDILPSEWSNYIPEYIDDSTTDKISSTTREKYEQAYSSYSTISIVNEAEELKHFDTDENGEKKYATEDAEKENPLMKPGYSTFEPNNTVLKIKNNSQLYSIGKTSASFTAKRLMYYRVSVWVKGGDENSTATIIMYGKVKTGDKTEGLLISQKQTTSDCYQDPEDLIVKPSTDDKKKEDTSAMDYNNGWTEIAFYIHGNAYHDVDIQLALLADKNSTIYYDSVKVENVLSTEYTSATSSKKLELTFSPKKGSSEQYLASSITNGYFENITTEEFDYTDESYTAPFKASSWTLDDKNNSKDVVAGIVPTGTGYYTNEVKEKLGDVENPNSEISVAQNNVYAVYAPKTIDEEETTHDYSITSSSFSLSSGSVYKVSFMVKYASGTKSNFTGTIKAYLTYSKNTISEQLIKVEENSTGKDTWYTYSFLVRTGSSARSTTITLALEDVTGTVFFKNVGFYKYSEATRTDDLGKDVKVSVDEQFEELYEKYASLSEQQSNRIAIVDYKSYGFTMHSAEKVEITTKNEDESETTVEKDYYESFSHTIEENTKDKDESSSSTNTVNGIVGVVDTNETEITLEGADKITNLKNSKSLSDTALLIYNESERYTTVSPKTTFTLESKSFYTIELYVKTSEFAEGNGLEIKMSAISVYFENIDTSKNTDNNGYTLYRAIVRTGSSSITGLSVNFILGTEKNKLAGYALVSDLKLTKLADVEAYNEVVEAVDENDKNTVVKNFYVEENSGDTSSSPVENQTLINFFLVFASLLTVVAIVIALVALYVKKHPKKRKVKVSTKDNKYKSAKTEEEKETTDKGGFV